MHSAAWVQGREGALTAIGLRDRSSSRANRVISVPTRPQSGTRTLLCAYPRSRLNATVTPPAPAATRSRSVPGVHEYATLDGGVARRWAGRSRGTVTPLELVTT